MTEKVKKVREAVKLLNELTESEWEAISTIVAQKNSTKDSKQETANNVISYKEYEDAIFNVFHQIGISANLDGYYYLKEAIMICIESDHPEKIRVIKGCYSVIAQKFETTYKKVERGIRHSIEIAWNRGNMDLIRKIFDHTIDVRRGKPTNYQAITMLALYVKRQF